MVDGTDDQPGTIGFQPVAGACSGTPVVIDDVTTTVDICGATDGSITVEFSGGTAPYTLDWDGPSIGSMAAISPQTITPLAAGTYDLTVTDDNGSSAVSMATILYFPVTNTSGPSYYATIQEAIDAAAPFDEIEVCEGTYTEAITINKSLTINGANEGTPGVDPRDPESVLLNSTINVSGATTVIIDGFKVERNDAVGGDIVLLGGSSATTFTNSIFERNGSATGTIVRAIVTSSGTGVKNITNKPFHRR